MSSSTPAPAPADAGAPKKSPVLIWIIALLVVAGGGAYAWYKHGRDAAAGAPGAAAPGAGKPGGARAMPAPTVATAVAKRGDFGIYVNTLGSVKAINTVTVRTRVEGEIMKIHFTEGSVVKAGDPLADIDPRPYQVQKAQAEGALVRDEALLENARRDLTRYKDAAEAVTQQQIDTAVANVAQLAGTVATDRANVDNAKLQLDYCHIIAPIAGKAGLRLVDAGNIVNTSDASGIVVITQMAPISVVFNVPENDLRSVLKAVASGETLTVDAYDREAKLKLSSGKLAALDNQIDATTGTLKLRGIFDNKDGELFPNQFVNVRLLVDTKKDVVLVPGPAVQINDTERFVYVLKADDTVERRTVKTGRSDESYTIITEGLAADEIVVTEGLDRLRDGAKVVPAGKKKPAGDRGKSGGEHAHAKSGEGKKPADGDKVNAAPADASEDKKSAEKSRGPGL